VWHEWFRSETRTLANIERQHPDMFVRACRAFLVRYRGVNGEESDAQKWVEQRLRERANLHFPQRSRPPGFGNPNPPAQTPARPPPQPPSMDSID
jgi:hypothetical protein